MARMPALRDLTGLAKRTLRYRSLDTASLIQRNLSHILAPLRPEGSKIRCDEVDLTIDPNHQDFYVEGLEHVYRTVKAGAGRYANVPDGTIEFQSGPVRIVPETAQELFIVDEIFRAGVYDLDAPEEWIVWDVGMNVGLATAFFAGVKGWETVSYEPFPEPFEAAQANIRRSGLEGRTTLRQEGISDRDQTLKLVYNRRSRGSNGLFGNNALDKSGEDVEVEAVFVDAARAVEELVSRANGRPILAKIDCEGAEYDIVRRLREAGLLRSLAAIFMEYHLLAPEHSYDALVRDLTEEGFRIHGQRHPGTHVGMLWAFRTD